MSGSVFMDTDGLNEGSRELSQQATSLTDLIVSSGAGSEASGAGAAAVSSSVRTFVGALAGRVNSRGQSLGSAATAYAGTDGLAAAQVSEAGL